MRHRKSGLKLGKTASHRQSMFKNMVTSLFKHDRIRTTDVKAKELRRWADHVITLAKRGDLHARRQVLNIIRDKNIVHDLFESVSEKYANRSGGYTRIVKIGRRAGDCAPISLIELIESDGASKSKRESKAKKKSIPAPTVDAPAATDIQESVEEAKKATETQETAGSKEAAVEALEGAQEEVETSLQESSEVQAAPEATATEEISKDEIQEGESAEDEKPSK